MAKLLKFDRKACGEVREHLEGWLESCGDDLGFVVKLGSAKFSGSELTFKLRCIIGDAEEEKDFAQLEFDANAAMYGMTPNDFGRKFIFGGKYYTVCGISKTAYKYPILGRSARGKVYKFPAKVITTFV